MISSVHIDNFSGLRNFVLDLAGRPFVLASGNAGSGKSAFCKALLFLRDLAIGSGTVGEVANWRVSLLPAGGLQTTLRMSFWESGAIYEYLLSFSYDRGRGEFLVEKEYVNCNGQMCANREENLATVWRVGAMPMTFALDKRTLLLSTASGVLADDPLFAVKRYLSRMFVLAPVAEMMNVDYVLPETWILQGNGGNLPSWYGWACRNLTGFKDGANGYVRRYVSDAIGVEVPNDFHGMSYLALRRSDFAASWRDIPFSALSSSEKLSVFFASLMAFRTLYPSSVVVVDDVIGGMQQDTRMKIVEDLHDTAGIGKQVVLFSTDAAVNASVWNSDKFRFVRNRSPEFVK